MIDEFVVSACTIIELPRVLIYLPNYHVMRYNSERGAS